MATPVKLHWSDADAEVHSLVVGPWANNVFIVRCKQTGDAVLIDAANEHERLLELCQRLGVKRVIETHGHHDHIQAVPAMREAGYDVAVTQADASRLPSYDSLLGDDEELTVGRLKLGTILTPGHTQGSICFQLKGTNLLFSGDTLFPGGPGATDKPGGSFKNIMQSLRTRLFTLPDDTLVLPGHGADTTIGTERPFLDEWQDRGW